MQRKYKRISEWEREEISLDLAREKSYRAIARKLERSPSTISREIQRGSVKTGYRPVSAQRKSDRTARTRRFGKRRLALEARLRSYVLRKLKQKWSPNEISSRIRVEYPLDMTMRISAEAIYQFIYVLPRGELKKTLLKSLRQERAYRRTKERNKESENRGKISEMLSIEERPKEVADRSVPGHWEGDLILGKYKRSALATLVERVTRYTILVPLVAKDAQSVRKALASEFRKLPKELARSLTYDQGKEMSQHKQFTIDTNIQVYFAHPSSPWERGTNENTNGLVRQYFPKGTDFSTITEAEIKAVERELNDRPRKILGYLKPIEVIQQSVALNC
ncbi:MAG: IS30 family transposase [bacterium]|nr:IS30 family transposase [bacterium]